MPGVVHIYLYPRYEVSKSWDTVGHAKLQDPLSGGVILHVDDTHGLGVVLSESRGMTWAAHVHEFTPLDDGSTGAIQLSGRVTAGDAVIEVNGRSMLCQNYDFVMSMIQEKRGIMTIAFGPPDYSPM